MQKLELLDPRSSEFCEVAARYYYDRFRVFRTGGIFFLFLGILSILLNSFVVVHWHLILRIAEFVGGGFFTILGWVLFYIGRSAIQMIKVTQRLDMLNKRREMFEQRLAILEAVRDVPVKEPSKPSQLDVICLFANGLFRHDEISKLILKRLKNETHAA